ncbi:MAG TPA: copper resistance protein CopC [Dermatophilaceae bacterium]|nr:copper resistance protein CopC [Dermatophilaceae bacterium]
MRWLLAAVAVLAGWVVVAGAPGAEAHAFLTSSSPADGTVLEQAPGRLVLAFSEAVVLPGTTVDVADGAGHRVTAGLPVLDQTAGRGASKTGGVEAPVRLTVTLPALPRGAYRVSWATVSADDLHRAAGVFVFGVQTAVAQTGWSESAPSPLESALRWLTLLGIAAGVGAPVARSLLRRVPGCPSRLVDRTAFGLAAVAASAAAALLVAAVAQSRGGLDGVVGTGYAVRWAARETGLLVVLLASAPRPRALGELPCRGQEVLRVAGALLAAGGTAALGHSGSGATGSPTAAAVAAVHVLATGAWLGGLGLLTVAILVQRPPAPVVRALLVGFGRVAAVAVAVTVISGLYLASGVVGSVDAFLLTDYGRLLALKFGLVACCLALAVVNRRRLRRPGKGLRRTLAAEAAGGVLILSVTGLLASGQPALQPQLVEPADPPSSTAYQQVSDLQESLQLRPNLPGDNVALIRVDNTRRPPPAPVTGVTVAVGAPALPPLPAQPIGDGRWSVPLRLDLAGPVAVRVTVHRLGLPRATYDYRWTVGRPHGADQPLVSRVPLQDVLRWAAAAAAAVLGAWGLVSMARRRRRGQATPPVAPRAAEAGAYAAVEAVGPSAGR